MQAEGYYRRSCKNGTTSLRYDVGRVSSLPYVAGRPVGYMPYRQYFRDVAPTVALMMVDVHFESNEAGKFGGALFGEQGVFAFARDSVFSRNSAGESGAVYFKHGMFYADGSSFLDNASPVSGGAITINVGLLDLGCAEELLNMSMAA